MSCSIKKFGTIVHGEFPTFFDWNSHLFFIASFLSIWGGAFFQMINIFACTCPNRSGVGVIDNPDRFEQHFDTYYIPETSEKIFMDDISMVRP